MAKKRNPKSKKRRGYRHRQIGAVAGRKPDIPVSASAGMPAGNLPVLGRPVLSTDTASGTAAGTQSSPDGDVFVDIQLAPGALSLRDPLTGDTAALFGAAELGSSASQGGLIAVLRRYRLLEARALHDDQQVQEDEQQTNALRQAAAMGTVSTERLAAREQVPSKASLVRLRFPPGTSIPAVKESLRQVPEVEKAEWVPRAAPPMALAVALPSDPLIGSPTAGIAADSVTQLETQWYLHRTRVLQAWRYSRGERVIIADLDWGFRLSHQEFTGAIERKYNAVAGDDDVIHGAHAAHGTAVLGIAGARANGLGMAGYAPGGVLWAIQADSSRSQQVFQEPWAEAIDFVRRTDSGGRRKVILLEVQTSPALGNYEQVLPVHRAIRAAIADDCVVCVAAGNGNRPADRNDFGEPFDPTGSILVGATAYHETQNKRAGFSNYGSPRRSGT
jgi:hypothetical protein